MTWRALISPCCCPSPRSRSFLTMAGRASACRSSEGLSNAASGIRATNSAHETNLETSLHETTMHNSPKTSAENNGDRTFCTPAENSGRCESQHGEQGHTSSQSVDMPRKGHVRRVREGRVSAKFQLKNSCVLALQRGDITKWSMDGKTDAIVNAANTRMLGGGGVDGAIHRAAGPDLYQACLKLPLVGKNIRCRTGDAVITEAFRLPVSKIVHSVGPVYENDEDSGPLLESSYKSCILLAAKSGLQYLAFPAISCGIYGYPYDKAAEIALDTVSKHSSGLKEVHFVLFEEGSWVEWLNEASKSFERLEEEH